jgi:hypothetical protein
MPRIDVEHCRKTFESELLNIQSFLQKTKDFKIAAGHGVHRSIGIRTVEMLAGLQLLRLYLVWEEFVESVFLRYICGCTSPSGFCPFLLCTRESNLVGATKTVFGKYKYLGWGPSDTIARAQIYFQGGEPFSIAIGSAQRELEAIYTIRNRFAHRSEYAQDQFRRLVRSELGYNPPGMTPGRFLLSIKTAATFRGQTFFDYYASVLLSLAHIVVP